MTENPNPVQRLVFRHPRAAGAVLLALGSVYGYSSVVSPIRDAHAHAKRLEISLESTMLGLALSILGLTIALFGPRCARLFQPGSHESKLPAYSVGVAITILGAATFYGLKCYLVSEGYVIQSAR